MIMGHNILWKLTIPHPKIWRGIDACQELMMMMTMMMMMMTTMMMTIQRLVG